MQCNRIEHIKVRAEKSQQELSSPDLARQQEWEASGDCAAAVARLKHKDQKIKSSNDVKFVHMHSDGSGGWNWREEAHQESGRVQGIYATLHEANAACKAQVRDDHNIDDHDEEECDSEDEDEAIYGSGADLEVEEFEYPSGKLRVRIS